MKRSEFRPFVRWWVHFVLFCGCNFFLLQDVTARTLYVAGDGSEEFTLIQAACDSAIRGDTVIVRDGEYYEETLFEVDSGVVLKADHNGEAVIPLSPGGAGFFVYPDAYLEGFTIIGTPFRGWQTMVYLMENSQLINCEFRPSAIGNIPVSIRSHGSPPVIRHCLFRLIGIAAVANLDSTDIWMPDNYWGTTDTVQIHMRILDGHEHEERGFVTVSPVAESFEWLAIGDAEQPRIIISQQLVTYPDPTAGAITLLIGEGVRSAHVTIYNLLGREVFRDHQLNFENGIGRLNVGGLSSGMYFVNLEGARSRSSTTIHVIK